MNLSELKRRLQAEGVSPSAYSLSGGDTEDTICIERTTSGWSVYYAERGERWDERTFANEDQACDHFLKIVLNDPTTREPRPRPQSAASGP